MSSTHNPALRLLEGTQSQPHLIPFFPTHDPPTSYPYSFSFHASPGGSYEQDHHLQQEDDIDFKYGRSSDPLIYLVSLPTNMNDDLGKQDSTDECDAPKKGSGQWMSSKMRLMKKMMSSDKVIIKKPRRRTQAPLEQQQSKPEDSSSSSTTTNPNGTVRVCSDCNTTKTPLWRSGPRGPKSLCNACGIRQRKARKAMAEAATNSRQPVKDQVEEEIKGIESVHPAIVPYKKRSKFSSAEARNAAAIGLDDLTLSLSKSSPFRGVFPQDEEEAAFLLMALSCSLKF